MAMERSITDEQLEWAAEMIRSGHGIRRVAKALKISKSALWYDLEVAGYDLATRELEYPHKKLEDNKNGNEENNKH